MTKDEFLDKLSLPDEFSTEFLFSAIDKFRLSLEPKLHLTDVMRQCLLDDQNSLASGTWANYKTLISQLETFLKVKEIEINLLEFDLSSKKAQEKQNTIRKYREIFSEFQQFVHEATSASKRTFNVKLTYMKRFTSYIDNNLGIKLPTLKKSKEISYKETMFMFPQAIVKQILNMPNTKHFFVPFAKVMLYSCWRISDLCKIQVRDLEAGLYNGTKVYYMTCVQQKTSKSIRTPIPRAVIDFIVKHYRLLPEDTLFRTKAIPRNYRDRITRYRKANAAETADNLRDLLSNLYPFEMVKMIDGDGNISYVKLAQYQRIVHSLRSAGATRYFNLGLPESQITELFTGHHTTEVLRNHYLYNDPSSMVRRGNTHINIFEVDNTDRELEEINNLNFLTE